MYGAYLCTKVGDPRAYQEFVSWYFQVSHKAPVFKMGDDGKWMVNATPEQFAKVLTVYQDLIFSNPDNPAMDPNQRGNGWPEEDNGYVAGKWAMVPMGPWIWGHRGDNETARAILEEKTGIAALPIPDGGVPATYLEVKPIMVNKHSENVDMAVLARGTPGFSGADLENMVNEAALLAAREEKDFLEMIDFDLRTTVEDVSDMLAQRVYQKGLDVACLVEPEVPSWLQGDPGRLRQILLNLISNAVKFTEEGEILIRATLDKETDTQATVRFAVKDTGIGIPANRLYRLFKSFSQADASTTRKYGGTGLGLAISKRLCEMMGGEIGVESHEGQGSTFWFTAVLEKQPQRQEALRVLPADILGKRILVVDDNATNREVLSAYLGSWDCQCDAASSAKEALRMLRQAVKTGKPFHLVILDHMMPGMDGEALGRAIKKAPAQGFAVHSWHHMIKNGRRSPGPGHQESPGAQGDGLGHAYFLGPAGRCGPGEGNRFQCLSDKACQAFSALRLSGDGPWRRARGSQGR